MIGFNNKVAGIHTETRKTIQWFNSADRFGLRAQLFHMLIAGLMIAMLAFGFLLDVVPTDYKRLAYTLHKGVGLWVLALSVMWFLHRLSQTTPERLPTQSTQQYRLAKLVHGLLIILCIVMPLSGWIMASARSGNPVTIWPGVTVPPIASLDQKFGYAMLGVHIVLAWSIIILAGLHLCAALYHHIVKRDPILKRMIPRFRAPAGYYRHQFDRARAASRKK